MEWLNSVAFQVLIQSSRHHFKFEGTSVCPWLLISVRFARMNYFVNWSQMKCTFDIFPSIAYACQNDYTNYATSINSIGAWSQRPELALVLVINVMEYRTRSQRLEKHPKNSEMRIGQKTKSDYEMYIEYLQQKFHQIRNIFISKNVTFPVFAINYFA